MNRSKEWYDQWLAQFPTWHDKINEIQDICNTSPALFYDMPREELFEEFTEALYRIGLLADYPEE